MKHKEIEYTKNDFEKEVWKDIPNYEGLYQASNIGRIRTTKNKTTHTNKHGDRHWKQRILCYKTSGEKAYRIGYRVDLWKDGKPKTWLVARLVAETFIGTPPNDFTVNHIDGNRLNNCVENLEWCSRADNIKKGFETGLYKSTQVKITNKFTNETKQLRSLSLANSYIGKNHSYIQNNIKRNKFENEIYRWEILK